MSASLTLRALPLLLCSTALGGEIHVVNVNSVPAGPTIQATIDAASSGDTIILQLSVPYQLQSLQGISIHGKGLTIVGRPNFVGAVPLAYIDIADLPAGETVVLRKLRSFGEFQPSGTQVSRAALSVANSAGAIRVDQCSFGQLDYGVVPSTFHHVAPSVDLDGGVDVTFHECSIEGSSGGALVLSRSRVVVYGSTITGGPGSFAQSYTTAEAGDGSVALDLRNRSFAWVGDSEIVGGVGGSAECIHGTSCVALPGDGGPGAIVEPSSLCVSLGGVFQGGAPGSLPWSAGSGSVPGVQGVATIGQVVQVPGTHRGLQLPSAVRSGETVALELVGVPGEEVVLLAGRQGGHRYFGPLAGALLVNAGFVAPPIVVGTVPASGRLLVDYSLPAVAAGEAETFSLQASFRTSPSRFRLSPVREVVVAGSGAPLFVAPSRLYVDAAAAPGGDGLSWQLAASSLADALLGMPFESGKLTEVWLAQGTYVCAPSTSPLSRDPISLGGAIELLGGFSGTETLRGQRDPDLYPVVISGDLSDDDQLPGGGPGENSMGMIHLWHAFGPETSYVSGVRFTGANGGSALLIYGAAVVDRCVFDGNDGDLRAGGLTLIHASSAPSTSIVRSSEFTSNAGSAGALGLYQSPVGGGTGSPTSYRLSVAGCSFIGNTARGSRWHPDGGRAAYGGAITAIGFTAGGLDETVQISNCTLVDNDNPLQHITYRLPYDGIYVDRRLDVTFTNNVSWSAYQLTGQHLYYTLIEPQSGDIAAYNRVAVIHPDWDATTNTTAAPQFIDVNGPDGLPGTGDENTRLAANSPCIDAGHSGLVPLDLTLDLDRLHRFVDDPATPNTGVGGARVVDFGAYERQ